MEDSISEKESLDIIRNMVEKYKGNIKEGSKYYLLWGWAVLLASIGQYIMIEVMASDYHWVLWPVFMIGAGLVSGIMGYRESKQTRYKTFIDNAMIYLWLGFVILLFLVLAFSQTIGWNNAYILVIALYGFGTFVSGGIISFRPLLIGGLISLALSFFAAFNTVMFEEFSNVLVLLMASITVSYLIPGYMLKNKGKSNAS